MADSWEDEDFVPQLPPKPISAFGEEEIKENWEDIDPNAAEQPTAEASSVPKETKKPTKKEKKVDKSKPAQPLGDDRKLTPQELEEIQKKSDLNLTKELFGLPEETGQGPSTKDEFSAYCKLLVNEIQKHKNQSEYYDFLSELFKELCVNLESEHVRRYGKEISALGAALHKNEKDAEAAKQKSKKKPTVVVSRKIDDLEDYSGGGGGLDDRDDDDFM